MRSVLVKRGMQKASDIELLQKQQVTRHCADYLCLLLCLSHHWVATQVEEEE